MFVLVENAHSRLSSYFLTASYDGALRAFDYSQKPVLTAPLHTAPVTSICLVPSSSTSPDSHLLASASHDLTARLTRFTLPSTPSDQPKTQTLASLHLHTAPLTSVAASPAGTHLLTASWDGLIGLWDTAIPEADEVPPDEATAGERKKRRRVAEDGEGARPKRKAPVSVLKSHTARVSRAVFGKGEKGERAYSCGLDSTVRTWDVESGVCAGTIVRLFSLSSPPRSGVLTRCYVLPREDGKLQAIP